MSTNEQTKNGSAPGMGSVDAREERLRALFTAAYMPLDPSQALQERVTERVTQERARRRPWHRWAGWIGGIHRKAAVVARTDLHARSRGTHPRLPAARWARVSLAVTLLVALVAGAHWAGLGVQPRLAVALRALEAREQRLSEIQVTYDVRRVTSQDPPSPISPYGRGQSFATPAGQQPAEYRAFWARKGPKLLHDESRLDRAIRISKRVRYLYDGRQVWCQFWRIRGEAEPPTFTAKYRDYRGTLLKGGNEVGLLLLEYTPPELLTVGAEVEYVGEQNIEGDRCLVFDRWLVGHKEHHTRVWLDPARGYMPRRYEMDVAHRQHVVQIFSIPREWAPGLFLPTRATGWMRLRSKRTGQPITRTIRWTLHVRDVALGGLSDDLFKRLPPR